MRYNKPMIFDTLREAIAAERPVALATVIEGEPLGAKLLIDSNGRQGSLGDADLDSQVQADALSLLDAETSESRSYTASQGAVTVLIEVYPPPPHLIIVGAVHTAIPLTTCAKQLGFRVTVVDPRGTFATDERFPDADALVVEWPDEALPNLRLDRSTYVAVLTHDPKLDDPAVQIALKYPVRYIGALGSPKTQAKRKQTLLEAGVPPEDLERIYGPIGLPLGSKTPAEIAISILAEMIAVRRGKRLGPLTS
ncbi:MAG TPA: XdhC/CoxI family protein [Herpetosiphonaceae bacterium]